MGKFTKTLAKMSKGEQKGFTLIELLIVVAIIGILAAVIIPNVMTFISTGRLNAARTEAENIKTAGLAYYADFGDWPLTAGQPAGANGDLFNTTVGPGARQYINKVTVGGYTWSTSGNVTGVTGSYSNFVWNNDTWNKP